MIVSRSSTQIVSQSLTKGFEVNAFNGLKANGAIVLDTDDYEK